MKRLVFPLAVVAVIVFVPQSAAAQEAETTSEIKLETLEKILESEESLSPETKKALVEALRGLENSVSAAAMEAREPSALEKLADRLSPYGDIRLRHESSWSLDDQKERHRERIRLRLGANLSIVHELTAGFRVSTGSRTDPNSPHVTLGSGFDRFELNLDRAFLRYDPEAVDGLRVTAGKFAHPFLSNPVYGELVWDADVQPEGAIAEYVWHGDGGVRTVELRVGEYILLEQGGASEALSTVGQLAARFAAGEHLAGFAAVGYSFYTDVSPDGGQDLVADSEGNLLRDRDGDGDADGYFSEFGILHPVVSLTYSGWCCPITFGAEYIWNSRAENSKEHGWAIGAAIGKTARRGDWQAFYQWQVIQQEAVFSPFVQDDFLLATNHNSHVFGVNYQAFENVGLRAWALVSQRDRTSPGETTDSRSTQWRARLDINVKF